MYANARDEIADGQKLQYYVRFGALMYHYQMSTVVTAEGGWSHAENCRNYGLNRTYLKRRIQQIQRKRRNRCQHSIIAYTYSSRECRWDVNY